MIRNVAENAVKVLPSPDSCTEYQSEQNFHVHLTQAVSAQISVTILLLS
jgi:hypothetical protein